MRAVYNASARSSRKTLAVLLACLLCLLMPFAAGAEAAAVPLMSIRETANDQMTFAIEFNMADVTEEQLAVYGSWLVDFEVKFNRDITLKADGTADGYLSGQLDAVGSGWVNIPSKERVLAAQEGLKTVECVLQQKGLSSLVKTTLKNAQSNMKTFNCGVYLAPEYMKANQGLIVTVQARLYNPEDAAQSLAMSDPYVYIVGSTPEEYFTYTVLNGTYCAVTGYTGTDGVVVIPSILGGYIVQEIAQEAFQNNAVMTKVTLPDTIEVVGNSAFAYCKNLQEVVFAEGWKTNISAYAFRNCTALTSVAMPEGVVAIGDYAFDGCSSLPAVKMPDTVETIGVAAFRNCKALEEVQFGSGLTTIYSYAFEGCTALTAITLPDSVIALGARAFLNCTGLAEVNFPKNWTKVYDTYYSNDTSHGDSSGYYQSPFEGCTSLTSIVIPEGVTAVPKHAFQNMDALTSITLPSTIEKIGNRAFQDADGLATIVIPEGVTVIEEAAFQNANALANVTAPATLTTLANYAFEDTGLVSIDLSATKLTVLNHRAFQNNKTLQAIKLPEGLTAINTYALYNCPALTDVQLPSTLTTIYSYAFEKCTALESITLPDALENIGSCAFVNCTSLSQVNFPLGWAKVYDTYYNNDTSHGDSSSYYCSPFAGCTALASITVPEGVTAIPKHAFQNMDGLTSISLPSTLEKIGNRAFQDADGLATIVIPEGVTTIEEAAFQNANKLTAATMPSTLTTLANYAFDDTALVSMDLSGTQLTTLNHRAFQNAKYLKSVKLPEGLTAINTYAFYNCTALNDVQLPSTLTTIYSYAFEGCTALTAIQLPDGLANIGSLAFYNCSRLSQVNFPLGWTKVYDTYYNNDTSHSDGSSYYHSPFEGCSSLKNMVVPEGVTSLPKHAFQNAAALRTVILPDTLTAIGNYAFHSATALENLRMWENVGIIGDQSFTNVKNVTIYGKAGSYAETFAAEKGFEFLPVDLRLYFATTKLTFTANGAPIAGVTVDFFDNTDKYLQDRVTAGDDGVLTYGDGIVGHEYTISWYHPDYDFAESAVTVTLTSDGFAKKITGEKGLIIEETPAAEFTYTTLTGNNIAITGYTGSRTEIMIPGEIDGYNVLQLNDSAFKNNKTITKIKLPDTIETVGNYAFQNCTALTDFVAGSRLKTVPEGMFDACASLKTVKLGGSVTAIGRVAFRNCKALTDVQLGSGLMTIYSYAFEGCTALTAIQLPDSVIALGARAFLNCTSLAEVNFPKNWTKVYDTYYNNDTSHGDSSGYYQSPFEGCTSLTSIVIPEGVTAVPKHAFQNMDALTEIVLPSTLTKIGNRAFQDADGLATIVIPEGVTVIEEAAFQNANALANVTAPATLTTLANYAFEDTGLVSIDLSGTKLTTLNHRAFQNNKTLQAIKLPEGLTAINTYAFSNCPALTDVQLPSTLTTIYSYAFEGCTALTAIQLPDALENIGSCAFVNCTSLSSVNFPKNWTKVYDTYYNNDTSHGDNSSYYCSPFAGCTSLTTIVVPEGVTAVPKHAFQNMDGLTSISLPTTLTKIGNRAFQDADGLASIVIPEGVTTIEEAAFQNANKLTAATMPSTLTTLANYAFDDTALVSMDLSGTQLTTLNHRAFQNAKYLKSVKLPEGLTAINTYAFYNCTALNDVQLPSTLTTIYSYAFEGCTALTAIQLPDNLANIGSLAFYNCSRLSQVNFPLGWTRVYDTYYNNDTSHSDGSSYYHSPFEGCSSLKNMVVPEGVTSLPKHAFQNAAALRTVILPDTLTAIGNYAFHNATALENLRMWENVGIIGDQSFTNVKNVTIYGKAGSYAETFAAEKGFEFLPVDLRLYFATTKLTFTANGVPIPGVTVDFFDNTDKYLQDRVTAGDDGVLTYGDGIVGHEYTISWYHPDYDFAESAVTITLTSDGFAKKITGEKGLVIEETPAAEFTYTVLTGNNIAITGYTGSRTEIMIPGEIDGYNVLQLNDSAFKNNKTVTKIKLPDTIETVGNYAFQNCTALTDFVAGSRLKNVPEGMFDACASLKTVKLGGSVTAIGRAAFRNCKALTDVQLGSGLTTIYSYAFEGCTALTAIQLPDSVVALGARAFVNCTNLAEVNFPKNWTKVYDTYYNNDTGHSDGSSYYQSPFEGCTSLTSIVIPEGVTAVPKHAFQNMDALTSITLPSTIEKIGNRAFQEADGLETIVIPEGVTAIEEAAFQNANALANVTVPATLTTLANYAFEDTGLVSIDLSATKLTVLNHRAFQNNKTLQAIKLPEGLTAINTYALYNCPALTDVQLPSTLTTIYSYAFEKCTALQSIQLPDALENIGSCAFVNCTSLSKVNFPLGWTRVYDTYYNNDTSHGDSSSYYCSPFAGCTALASITVPEGVTAVPKHAFQNMDGLNSITLPSTLEKIGNRAFQDADGLATIVIPEGVTTIEEAAFQNANKLTAATMPSTLTTLANYAFDDTALVNMDLSGTQLTTLNHRAFQNAKSLKSVKLPEGLTAINTYAFYNCTALNDVQLPSTLTTIYSYAFESCTALTAIQLPDSLANIGSLAFYNCSRLSQVNFPQGWTRVYDTYYNNDTSHGDGSGYYHSPFVGCSSLRTITVPEGVTAIPKHAFQNADGLAEISLPSTLSSIGVYAFHDADGMRYIDFPAGLKTIGAYAFRYASNLSMLNLPEGLESIGNYAFADCVGLRNIYLNGLATVPDYAFFNCDGLVSVMLDEGTTVINQYAFADCGNLSAIYLPKEITALHKTTFNNCGKLVIYCYSGTVVHVTVEAAGWRFELLDNHEHDYAAYMDTEPSCLRGGSKMLICTICSYTYIELTDALGHEAPEEFTVTVEPGCLTEGYQQKRCTRCDLRLEGEVLPPAGHAWNDWVVEQQPTIFSWGLRWHDCSRCGAREEEPMAKLEVPEGDLDKYGYAYFRVVNANDKTPLMGAQITIKLNEEETLNMVTNAEGRAEHVLPVGSLRATVFMPGMMSRNITITVTNGECVIPDIGLSATDTIQGQLTVTEMTYQEILDAGIDVNHPDNQHVYKYAIELHFSPSIDILNIFYFMNGGGWNPFGEVFYTPDPDSDWERKTDANGRPYFFLPGGYGPGGGGPGGGGGGGNNGGGGGMSVYPISEDFYLIIYGEVRWLKEMFDAELLVINTSQTDTLTNVQASLELPKGMSLATMVGDQQTSTINLGTIDCGQQKTAHWYLRGDEAGDYAISAHLTGTMQPFGEEINRTYKTSENIHVYAGNAMHLTYYVQDAAYYGVDYIVRAELENVSHKTLYNVSHLITGIKEGKITHYSDGSVKETVYLKKDGVIASNFAQYFHPGDKLVIELSIPIHFESEIIQRQLDQVKDCITMIENIANIMGFIDDVTSFMGDYEDFFDSVTSLTPDSGIGDRLETVKNGYTIAETLFGKDDEKDEVLSVWDSLRNVVQSIPVRFDLVSAQVHVLEGSTTEIPTTIIPVHTPGSPWVVQLDKYLTSILITMFGDLVEVPDTGVGLVDFALENIVDIKGQIGYEEALAYRHAIDQQVQNILARVPGSEIGVRVWTEYGSLKVKPVAVASKTVGGVTSFNGSAYLEVTPNGKDDVLYVEVDGEVTSYPFDVVQAHTCKGTWKPLVFPTEKTRGLEALVCGTCGKALETRVTSTCGDHTFDGWQTDVEATAESLGIVTRMCTKCHVVEYRVVNEDGGVYNTVSFKGNGGKGKMEDVPVPFDKPYTLPECTFTHDSLQFACWNTMADGTGESYAPGMEIELTNNITFYAIWTETGRMQYDMSGVQLSDTALPYNGQAHTVTITGLPEGVTLVSAEGLTATDMGEYTVTAVLATNDPFYETPALPALTWAIRPAISYAGEAEYTYNGKNPVADEFDLLVEEEPVLTYAALTTDGSGAEVVTSLTAAPVNAGKYRVTASVTFGEPAYTETVTADYAILPRDVTVAPASLVWEYNGEKAVNNRWTASGLISGDEVTGYAIQGGEILPGVYEEAYTISGVIITNKVGADVTGNYNVTCAPGKLTIVKRLVTVTADDVMAEYDGKPHGGTRYHAENLLAGHSVTGVTIPGTGVIAGNYVNWLLPEGGQVVDGEGNDLMHLYELQYKTGDMVIVPRDVTVTVRSVECAYQAAPVANNGYTVDRLAEGHAITLEITGEATVPGDYPGLFVPGEATVTDAAGEDVTVNYAISYKPGDLTILPAPLTVTAPSATHEYDGKDVTCDEYTFTGLVGGDTLTGVTVEGTYRTPGTYDNAFTPVGMKIVAADGADVTACYAITVESGSLTIAPRALTIKADDRTVRYNGESHGGITFTADRLAEGHSVASIVRTGSASAEGVHTDILKVSDAVITDETGADVTACYTITYKPGTLAIVTIEASDMAISADTLYLREGDKVRLVLTNRNGGGLPDMEWHSDSSAVTVNDNGVVTCHAAGSATITVSLKGMTDVMAACTVYADDMKQLSLPTMLAQVEEEAWMNNPALRVVDFSNAIEPTIGDRAFKDCGKLVKVLLPEATTIGEDAFDGCNSLVLYCTDKDAAAYAKAHGIPYVMLLQVGN